MLSGQNFQQVVITTLQSYCSYRIWQPKRYKEATTLAQEIKSCSSNDEVLEKLYKAYNDLLRINSNDKLVPKLALLLADALSVNKSDVSSYMAGRDYVIYAFGKKCDKETPPVTIASGNTWSYREETYPAQKDPILIAYEERRRLLVDDRTHSMAPTKSK